MTVRNVRAAHPNGLAVEAQIGTGGDAVLKPTPNTRAQQEHVQQVLWEAAASRPDYVDLMCTVFQPPRAVLVKGSGIHHPADCPCTAATCRKRRARVAARAAAALDPSTVPHGTSSGYVYHGCRCPECTTAHSAASTKSRKKKGETDAA